jgi:predicted house-cleaning noncanonical NTP pyrophosphatase (MazG superfamily)
MNNRKLIMDYFNEEIHVKFEQKTEQIHIDGFIDYCETFNIDLFSKEFFEDPNDERLNSEREIKQNLITFFKPSDNLRKIKVLKDKGQGELCECIMSKDTGQYNIYCYANTSKEITRRNYKTHIENKILDTITEI